VGAHGDTHAKAERHAVISQPGLPDTPATCIGDKCLYPASAKNEEKPEVTVV
jgi:hypothetical protein